MEAETHGIRYSNFDQRLHYLLLWLANHEGDASLGKALYAASLVELTSSTSHSWVFQIITCWLERTTRPSPKSGRKYSAAFTYLYGVRMISSTAYCILLYVLCTLSSILCWSENRIEVWWRQPRTGRGQQVLCCRSMVATMPADPSDFSCASSF